MFRNGVEEFTCVLCTVKRIATPVELRQRTVVFEHIDGELHTFASVELVVTQLQVIHALLSQTNFDEHLECALVQLNVMEAKVALASSFK